MKKLPTHCPICKSELSAFDGAHKTGFEITYCANCTLPIKDSRTVVNTAFEVRLGFHESKYLTRIILYYSDWRVIYYPFSDENSPPEIHFSKFNKLFFSESIGEGFTTLEDWEDWSDVNILINKVKMILVFE